MSNLMLNRQRVIDAEAALTLADTELGRVFKERLAGGTVYGPQVMRQMIVARQNLGDALKQLRLVIHNP